jgi:hypothetical protein
MVFDEKNLKRQTVPEVKIMSRLAYTQKNIHFVQIINNFRRYRKTPHIVPRTDRTFFLILGVTSGILCAAVYFFFNYFGYISTQFRPGHRPQKSFF